jgi:hypothetical protein
VDSSLTFIRCGKKRERKRTMLQGMVRVKCCQRSSDAQIFISRIRVGRWERKINKQDRRSDARTYVKSIIRAAASVALHFPVMDESFNAGVQRAYSF